MSHQIKIAHIKNIIAHIKLKLFTSNYNCSHQIIIANINLKFTHIKLKFTHIKLKFTHIKLKLK